jgi:DNA-binding transcriptional MerR regulator
VKLTDLVRRFGDDEHVKPRLVRFLITEGIIDPPRGGRANADYGEDHVEGIRRYLRLRDWGFSLTMVRDIARGVCEDVIPVEVIPGVTLQIDPSKLDGTLEANEIAGRIAEIIEKFIRKETPHAEDARHDP